MKIKGGSPDECKVGPRYFSLKKWKSYWEKKKHDIIVHLGHNEPHCIISFWNVGWIEDGRISLDKLVEKKKKENNWHKYITLPWWVF